MPICANTISGKARSKGGRTERSFRGEKVDLQPGDEDSKLIRECGLKRHFQPEIEATDRRGVRQRTSGRKRIER